MCSLSLRLIKAVARKEKKEELMLSSVKHKFNALPLVVRSKVSNKLDSQPPNKSYFTECKVETVKTSQ